MASVVQVASTPTTMRAAVVRQPGADFEIAEVSTPVPARGQVRIRVAACGICHSDAFIKDGLFPGIAYPRIPGHEVIGRIDAVGDDVTAWAVGDRVGVGWHGGHCFQCESCREGDYITCSAQRITGVSHDGGYAEYMVAPQEAVARVPDGLDAVAAAPLLCAGITTYNALRHSGARAGDIVAVHGIGGLGHLAVQFAQRMGFRTVAVSRGADKEQLARDLGAHEYIDTTAQDPAEVLTALGGATVVLATAPNSQAISALVGGLRTGGRIVVLAPADTPLSIPPLELIMRRRSVHGWPSGDAKDSEETMNFSRLQNVRARVEPYPLAKVEEAYHRMITNAARFRVILTMDGA